MYFSLRLEIGIKVKILEDEAKILVLFYLRCIVKDPLDPAN